MDPVTAIALVGNILQFSEFAFKFLKSVKEAFQTGELRSTTRLESAVTHVRGLVNDSLNETRDFKTRLEGKISASKQTKSMIDNEDMLEELCTDCLKICDTLLERLQNLKDWKKIAGSRLQNLSGQGNVLDSSWRAFLMVLKTVWSQGDIKSLMERVEQIRKRMEFNILVSLSSKVNFMMIEQSERFRAMTQENRHLISDIFSAHSAAIQQIRDQSVVLQEMQNQITTLALLTSRLEFVLPDKELQQRKVVPDVFELGTEVIGAAPMQSEEMLHRGRVAKKILESLVFNSIEERYTDISDAHRETFQWAFESSRDDDDQRTWSNFTRWLSSMDGVYWIRGKAASGKSTLIKFIVGERERISQLLHQWASKSPEKGQLLTASFFFWASGTRDQRSQSGLLRSILYEILAQEQLLIPVVFPHQWSILYSRSLGYEFHNRNPEIKIHSTVSDYKFSWTILALKDGLMRLVSQTQVPRQFCLFIDGLDEYEGDESEIANLFLQLAQTGNLKCCLSSRPHQAFLDAFENVPSLRLEDLTYSDIVNYVTDKLSDDTRLQRIAAEQPEDVQQLIQEIVNSASGVFLWVKLVVDSLLRGLGNRDKIKDLQARLQILPRDLEPLYERMVHRVDEIYQEEAAKMFQLVEAASTTLWNDPGEVQKLSLLGFYFAMEDRPAQMLDKTAQKLRLTSIKEYCADMASRLVTRCGGLLEISRDYDSGRDVWRSSVGYMHRTVKDYISQQDTVGVLRQRTRHGKVPFNPDFAIVKSTTVVLRSRQRLDDDSKALSLITSSLVHVRRAFNAPGIPPDLLNRTVDQLFYTAQSKIKKSDDHSSRNLWYPYSTRYTIAVEYGLDRYLRYLLESKNIIRTEPQSHQHGLLQLATKETRGNERFIYPKVIKLLVSFGSDSAQAFHYSISILIDWTQGQPVDLDRLANYESYLEPTPEEEENWMKDWQDLFSVLVPLQPHIKSEDLRFLETTFPNAWEDMKASIEKGNTGKGKESWNVLKLIKRNKPSTS